MIAIRPIYLYALASVVSLVGLNIHFGVTVYLSRIVTLVILTRALMVWPLVKRGGGSLRLEFRFLILFAATVCEQAISALRSGHSGDDVRMMFIYLSMMAIFISVLVAGRRVSVVEVAVTCYLVVGLLQAIYGIAQVVGGPRGWPTYQSLMANIPTANDRTVNGYFYTPAYGAFRAIGFFPADVSQFAGYMVGVVLLGITRVVAKRTPLLGWLVAFVGSTALALSLSRSGIVTFLCFGLPCLMLVLWHLGHGRRLVRIIGGTVTALCVLGVVASQLSLSREDLLIPDISSIMSTRLQDLVRPGESDIESMAVHIATRRKGLEAFAASPLFGVGLGINASPWYAEGGDQEGWGGSHSHHLDMLGETGLAGAMLQWIFMVYVAHLMWRGMRAARKLSAEQLSIAGLLVAYLSVLFGNLLYHYYLSDFVWLMMGAGVALGRELEREKVTRVSPSLKTRLPRALRGRRET